MTFTGTVMPIADRIKKLKSGMQGHVYNETGSNPKEVTRTIVEKDGKQMGEFVKVGDKVLSSCASPDVKSAGIDISGECVATNPTHIAETMDDDNVVQGKDDVKKEEKVDLQKGLFSNKPKPQPQVGSPSPVYYAEFKNRSGYPIHKGHFRSPEAVQRAKQRAEAFHHQETTVDMKVLPKAPEGVEIEKSAPVGFSFGSTLQKCEKFRKAEKKTIDDNPFPPGGFKVSGNHYDPSNYEHPSHISHHAAFELAKQHGVPIDSYNKSKQAFENPAAQNNDQQVDFHKFMGWLGY
jgi:hypothetical protein